VDRKREPGVSVSAHVPLSLYQRMVDYARKNDMSVSGLIRIAVEKFLEGR